MPTEPSSTLGGKTPLGYPRGVFLIASSRSSVEASRHGMDESDSDASLAGGECVPLPCAQRAHVLSYPTRVRRQRLRGRQHIVPVSAPSKRSTCVQPPGHSRASSEQPVCARCPCGAAVAMSSHAPGRPARTVRGRACRAAQPTARSLVARCPATAHSHSRRRVGRPCPPPPSGVPSSGSMRIPRRRGCVVCSRHAFRGQPSIHCSHTDRPLPGRCPLPPSYGTNPPPRGASAPWLNACRLDAPCSWHLSVGQLRTALPIYPLPAC